MTSRTSRDQLKLVAALASAFVALTVWVDAKGPIPGDQEVFDWAQANTTTGGEYLSNFQQFFAGLGSPIVAFAIAATAVIVTHRNVGANDALLVFLVTIGCLIEWPVAQIVGMTDAASQTGLPEGGYPSGHTLFAMTTFGSIALVARRHGRKEVATIAVTLLLLMGAVRVTDRTHLLSEVLAGYLLGATWLCLVLLMRAGPRWRPTMRNTQTPRRSEYRKNGRSSSKTTGDTG